MGNVTARMMIMPAIMAVKIILCVHDDGILNFPQKGGGLSVVSSFLFSSAWARLDFKAFFFMVGLHWGKLSGHCAIIILSSLTVARV